MGQEGTVEADIKVIPQSLISAHQKLNEHTTWMGMKEWHLMVLCNQADVISSLCMHS